MAPQADAASASKTLEQRRALTEWGTIAFMHSDRILEVDGLRAIAVTLVVAQHCNIMPIGWMGVWIFYVISGYVITRNFLKDDGLEESNYLRFINFFIKRSSRIIPVYFLYLVVGAVVYSFSGGYSHLSSLPFLVTFTYNWLLIFQTNGMADSQIFSHLWSLSVEEQFYIFYPVIFILIVRKTYLIFICLLIIFAPAIRYIYLETMMSSGLPVERASWAVYHSSIAQFDAFLAGAFIANWEPRIRRNPRLYTRIFGFVAGCGLFYLIYVVSRQYDEAQGWLKNLSVNVYPGELIGQNIEIFVYSAINSVTVCAIILAILRIRLFRFLSILPIEAIGRISYGVYLYQGLVFWIINYHVMPQSFAESSMMARMSWFVLVFGLSVAIAYQSFYRYEVPVMQLIRRKYLRNAVPTPAPTRGVLVDPP